MCVRGKRGDQGVNCACECSVKEICILALVAVVVVAVVVVVILQIV